MDEQTQPVQDPIEYLASLTVEDLTDLQQYATPEELAEWDRLMRPTAQDLEAAGWRTWYAELFGHRFVECLDSAETEDQHHSEALGWHWEARRALLQGKRPPNDWFAYFPTWSRGHMKSTLAEALIVTDAGLSVLYKQPGFALYIGREKGRIQESIANIETLLSSPPVRALFPTLSQVARNEETNQKRQWTGTFLHTRAQYVVKGGTIESAQAGSRVVTEAGKAGTRPTFFVPDDIDGRDDSPVIAASNLRALTTEILPMRQANTLTFWAQNLISRYTCRYQIETQTVRVLTNRKPTVRVPAVRDLVTIPGTVDGVVRDLFVSGRITWRVWDAARVQDEINAEGLPAFLRECQHEVEQSREGLVLQNWDDPVHVISLSQFDRIFGTRELPRYWSKYVYNDWARTKTKYHANVAGLVTVSPENTPLPGCVFVFNPMSFPAGSMPEDVALRLLKVISPLARRPARDPWEKPEFRTWEEIIKSALDRGNLERFVADTAKLIEQRRVLLSDVIPKYVEPVIRAQNYQVFRCSHERTDVQKVYRTVFGLPFQGINPGSDGGTDTLNLLQRVDYKLAHPIVPGKMGYTRFFLVVPDDEARPCLTIDLKPVTYGDGRIVYEPMPYRDTLTPDELVDYDLFRFQMRNWRLRDPYLTSKGEVEGELLKMNDDFGNGLMMLFYDGCVQAVPLTGEEKVEAAIPAGYHTEELAKREDMDPAQKALTEWWVRRDITKRMKPQNVETDDYGERL